MSIPDDDTCLEILAFYQGGYEAREIDAALSLPPGTAAQVIAADQAEYPNEPLRVLH